MAASNVASRTKRSTNFNQKTFPFPLSLGRHLNRFIFWGSAAHVLAVEVPVEESMVQNPESVFLNGPSVSKDPESSSPNALNHPEHILLFLGQRLVVTMVFNLG